MWLLQEYNVFKQPTAILQLSLLQQLTVQHPSIKNFEFVGVSPASKALLTSCINIDVDGYETAHGAGRRVELGRLELSGCEWSARNSSSSELSAVAYLFAAISSNSSSSSSPL
jgi:hypothetical protein